MQIITYKILIENNAISVKFHLKSQFAIKLSIRKYVLAYKQIRKWCDKFAIGL